MDIFRPHFLAEREEPKAWDVIDTELCKGLSESSSASP